MSRKQFTSHNKAIFDRLADRLSDYVERYRRISSRLDDDTEISCPYFQSLSDGLDGIRIHVSGAEEVLDMLADKESIRAPRKVAEVAEEYATKKTHPTAEDAAAITREATAKHPAPAKKSSRKKAE